MAPALKELPTRSRRKTKGPKMTGHFQSNIASVSLPFTPLSPRMDVLCAVNLHSLCVV